MRTDRFAFLAVALVSLLPVSAGAHAHLNRASPAAGSVVTEQPSEVRMWFSEALEPRFSKAELVSATGSVVATGGTNPADRKQLVVPVGELKPGVYKILWHAISADTHRTDGDFSFEIKP
jgi:methionine-rich copper-binding protein CopC